MSTPDESHFGSNETPNQPGCFALHIGYCFSRGRLMGVLTLYLAQHTVDIDVGWGEDIDFKT